jgi:hypothetical protein
MYKRAGNGLLNGFQDPERADTLFPPVTSHNDKASHDDKASHRQFVFVILDFFKKRLKMQQ